MLSKSQVEASIRSSALGKRARKGVKSRETPRLRFRFIIFIPFVTSAIAFAFHLILLNAGADFAQSPGYFLLSIDTSHVFERIIVVKNADNAQRAGQNNGTDTRSGSGSGSGSGSSNNGDSGSGLLGELGNLLPNLPSPGQAATTAGGNDPIPAEPDDTGVNKFFGSLRGGFDRFFTSLLKNFENRFVDDLVKLAPGVDRFLTGLLRGLTAEVNDKIQQFILRGVQEVRDVVGIEDRYDVYYSNICRGNLRNRSDPSTVQYSACGSIKDLTKQKASGEAPANRTTFFVLGTTNVTFPFLEPGSVDLRSATVALDFITTVNQVSLYISLATSVLNFVLAPAVFLRPDSRPLVTANIVFASLTPGSLLVGAVASTLAMAVIRDLANDVGKAVSVRAGLGAGALVLLWLSWFLSLATAAFWDLYWFVYLRQEVWVKMKKPADEVGSWKKSFAGARRRVKVREEATDEEKWALGRGGDGEDHGGEVQSWKRSFADARRRSTKLQDRRAATESDASSQRRLNVRESVEVENEGEKERAKMSGGISSIGKYRLSPISVGRPSSSIISRDPSHRGRVLT
ncbi:hypothetical protein PG991_014744 [Apiospora marii]|uniref:Uncharacterized protein n=1 Tax=Apiospora marii TaxID=335849 RepID=A0ABR1R4J1_9PEZI